MRYVIVIPTRNKKKGNTTVINERYKVNENKMEIRKENGNIEEIKRKLG